MALAAPAHAKYTCSPPPGVYPEVCDIGSSMPVYDQTHPAFATVNVPNDIYCSELKPADGGVPNQLCVDSSNNFCVGGSSCVPITPAPHAFAYNTWLPHGAFAGDQEWQWQSATSTYAVGTASGGASTNFCGSVTGSMILTTAINTMASTQHLVAGSWTKTWFHPGTGVPDYNSTPDPAKPLTMFDGTGKVGYDSSKRACHLDTTTNTLVDCMSQNDVQRVINYNILRSVDPTDVQGSNDGSSFKSLVNDFSPAATYVSSNNLTFAGLKQVVQNGDIVQMRHTEYFVTITTVSCPGSLAGDVCKEISISQTDPNGVTTTAGHYELLRGYSLDSSGTYTFFFNNPAYGWREEITGDFTDTGMKQMTVGTYYQCGTNEHRRFVAGGSMPAGQGSLLVWPVAKTGVNNRFCQYLTGDATYLATSYSGLRVQ
jgi:hypothetical protein